MCLKRLTGATRGTLSGLYPRRSPDPIYIAFRAILLRLSTMRVLAP